MVLVNARDVKNLSGRKTDEADAEWLMLLHSYGLLKCSFQPENEARAIRNLIRHRSNLLQSSSREALHMQKAMEQMNLKLGNFISDLLGKSGMAIIKSAIDGNHNPQQLAMLAEDNCKATKEEIAKSLEGTWTEDHLFELKQAYELCTSFKVKFANATSRLKCISYGIVPIWNMIRTMIHLDVKRR